MFDLINNLRAVGFEPKTVITIAELKKGDYFQLKPNGPMYVRSTFSHRKNGKSYYNCYKFDDVNAERQLKGETVVITDAIF